MEQVKLSAIQDLLQGELKEFTIKDKELFVINLNGRFYCLDGRCTHAGAPLWEGTMDGEILTCPWHGSKFNVTSGAVVGGPAVKPLGTYKTIVKEAHLYIEI